MEKTLMHTCCAPCSVACIHQLRSEGIEPVSYWFNPNIHPYQEYKARRDTLMAYAPTIGMALIVQEDYGLRDFCSAVAGDIDHRCGHCYTVRLEQTARFAARRYGVKFLYRDFRPGFRAGQQEARELGFYMQKYCGCVFSEEERYQKQIQRDLKEPLKHIG